MSYDISWKIHCFETAKCASKIANIILHSFSCTDVNIYLRAFDTYVMPILNYCSYVWTSVFACDMNVIENVERSFMRRVFYKCGFNKLSYGEHLQLVYCECIAHWHLLLSRYVFQRV